MRRLDRVGGTATILVTDLVGSTAMFDRLGDERAERLLRAHLGELRDQVRSFGGVEVKSTGDGIMAAFPAAWLATECAVAMQRSLHLRNERAGEGEEPLHIRIGLHSGDTTADRHDYYGIAVAVAARLCDKAPTDGILVSGVTRGLVGSRGGHSFADAGVPSLKGIDEPVQAWALEWGPGQLPPATPPGLERRKGPLVAAGAGALLIVGLGAGVLMAGGEEPRDAVRLEAPGELVRVSVKGGYENEATNGGETTGNSSDAAISGNGETVVYVSTARNLVPEDPNGAARDVFHVGVEEGKPDLTTLQIVSQGRPSTDPSISEDGTVVAFVEDDSRNGPERGRITDVVVRDVRAKTWQLASINRRGERANGRSFEADVSADGDFVAFTSVADNLSRLLDKNGKDDVFVHDLTTGNTNRVNIRSGNRREANGRSHAPALSADGRFVAFASVANSLTPRDTNNSSDVFRFDRDPDEFKTVRASVTSEGDLTEGDSDTPSISDDGNKVAFVSRADNLAEGDDVRPDVFVHDFVTGETTLVSRAIRGDVAGAGGTARPSISGDGNYVVFDSSSDDLVPHDDNGARDVFLYEIETGEMTRLSLTAADEQSEADSFDASISRDGRYVVFTSVESLVDGDHNLVPDVYLRGPLH